MFIKKFLTVAILATGISTMATSQTVELNALSVEGLVVGHRYVLDAEFSAEHNIAVPAPFEFIAPKSDDYQLFSLKAPGGTGIIKVFFVAEGEQVLSNIQFLPMTVTNTDMQAQLDGLKALAEQAFKASVPDLDNAALDILRITRIGELPALEAIGRYQDGESGLVVLRVVAIPNPNGENGVIAIINAVTQNRPMQSVEEVMAIEASRALGTFRFQ